MSFMSFDDLPEEEQNRLLEEAGRRQMGSDDFAHGVLRLFSELDSDQLQVIRHMFSLIGQGNVILAGHWEGMAATERMHRFNLCPIHGIDHDKEIEEELTPKTPEEKDAADIAAMTTPESFSKKDRELMEKYHVDDLYQESSGKYMGLVCTGIKGMKGPCGVTYPSLEDRMLREPESCSGCHQRMAHG